MNRKARILCIVESMVDRGSKGLEIGLLMIKSKQR